MKNPNIYQLEYVPAENPLDYSELVTEPDLTLSMREIVQRFVNNQPLGIPSIGVYSEVDDDYEIQDYEEPVDVILHATELRQRAENYRRRAEKLASKEGDSSDDARSEAELSPDKSNSIDGPKVAEPKGDAQKPSKEEPKGDDKK